MDLPCSGWIASGPTSTSSEIRGTFGVSTLFPSTNIPLPPKNDRMEQFWIYGDLVIVGLSNLVA